MSDKTNQPSVWVLADDRAGNVNQATGLAETLGFGFKTIEIGYDSFVVLPNFLRADSLVGTNTQTRRQIVPPWPDIVISAGRRSAPVARHIKKQAPETLCVHLMDPGATQRRFFDLVAIPAHDSTKSQGRNIMRTVGAMHRITQTRLTAERENWQPAFAHLPEPRIGVIVGGATKNRPFTTQMAAMLAKQVGELGKIMGNASLLITTSRRTGTEQTAILRQSVADIPHFFYGWGDEGENPYFGFLACSDALVVTGDSVSMCSECCATTSPVYIFAPENSAAPKHRKLHASLYDAGVARPLDNTHLQASDAANWTHPPLNDTTEVTRTVRKMFEQRQNNQ